MPTFAFHEWLNDVESTISVAIAKCNPRYWHENHISFTWLRALIDSQSDVTTIHTFDVSPFSIAWDAYKAGGRLETEHGDIVFLVRCSFRNGRDVEGVGFLEAKRINTSGSYDALDWSQLDYQNSHVGNHRLLLYDSAAIHPAGRNLIDQGFCMACTREPYGAIRAAVVLTQHALALRQKTRSLHRLSIPLSYQICCRYLRGLDLDWNANLVRAVKAGAVPGIQFLFVAHALIGVEGTPSVEGVEIERDHFRRIEPGEDFLYE